MSSSDFILLVRSISKSITAINHKYHERQEAIPTGQSKGPRRKEALTRERAGDGKWAWSPCHRR